jgi:uncharacterized protein (DUF2141 family)
MDNFILTVCLCGSWFVKSDTLTIITRNVQVGKGSVFVSVWNDEKTFLKKPFTELSEKADGDTLVFLFVLPEGQYAISAYQDLNDNKKLDLGIFGIPKEPIGFGNNFRPKMSAPKFRDCAIDLSQSMAEEIELK